MSGSVNVLRAADWRKSRGGAADEIQNQCEWQSQNKENEPAQL